MTPEAGVRLLAARFYRVTAPAGHFALVDNPRVREQILWVRRNRKDLWGQLRPAIMTSWRRIYPEGALLREAARDSVNVVLQNELPLRRKLR